MNRNNKLILAFDCILALIFVLMFRYYAISPAFHEIGGLALFVLTIVHLLINRAWIKSFVQNFSHKPGKVRLQMIVDVLFFVAFVVIIITGVMMSRIPPFELNIQSGFANSAHTIASYAALALLGIHIGLNWNWICTKVSAHIPLSAGIKKALAYIALVLVLVLGGISATQINFASLTKGGHGKERLQGVAKGGFPRGVPDGASSGTLPEGAPKDMPENMPEGARQNLPDGAQQNGGAPKQWSGRPNGGHGGGAFSLKNLAVVILNFGSLSALFGIAAYYLLKISRKARKA